MDTNPEPGPTGEHLAFDGFDINFFDGPEPEVLITLTGTDGSDDFAWALNPLDAMTMGKALCEVAQTAGVDPTYGDDTHG